MPAGPITVTLTQEQRAALNEVIREQFAHYHETLQQSQPDLAGAMVAYDNEPLVGLLRLVDPDSEQQLRDEVFAYLVRAGG